MFFFDLQGFSDLLLAGALMTVALALSALVVGLALGFLGAAAKTSRLAPVRWLAGLYTTVVRGVPELVLVLFIYYGGTILLNEAAKALGYDQYIDVSPFAAGVTALGLTFGAYATEVIRGAVLAIPPGQIEAGHAFGMRRAQVYRRIIVPQVWRLALPGLGNTFLVILKETALVSVIGLEELMRKTEVAVGFTKEPFTFFLFAAVLYLAMTVVTMTVLQRLERRAARGIPAGGAA